MIKATQFSFFVATIFLVATFFIYGSSQDSPPDSSDRVLSGNCVLDLSTYPYQPSGECTGSSDQQQTRLNQWDSVRTTLCCRNVLAAFSEALALRLVGPGPGPTATVFLPGDLWSACAKASFLRQPSVSAASCGLDLSSGGPRCSALTLRDVRARKDSFGAASAACSAGLFDNGGGACRACAAAVQALRDDLLAATHGDGDKRSERAACGVAAVVSVASLIIQNQLQTQDFFQCLHILDQYDPDYIKIKHSLAHILLALVVAITTIMLIVVLVKHVTKKKKNQKPEKSKELASNWAALYRFSKEEIDNAINYYGTERESLGKGSAGHVYKGVLPSGQVVAIKHIIRNNNHTDSFKREAEGPSRIRHPNLVCLFGYCMEEDGNYLVYEYCSGGNLAQQLLNTLLNWDKRVKILRDCALALRHLHHFVDGCIVHRDIKLTNILLTDKLETAKLSDFGLARIMNMEESKVFTDVRGTIGYMDPEYMTNAKLTCASDVYSFGIVILQILSGQKVIELNFDERDQLTRKAKDVSLGNRPVEDFEDPRLDGKVNKADFKSILQIAVLCVAKASLDRPNVDIVFQEMDKAWRNTDEFKQMKKAKHEPGTSSTMSQSTSTEGVLPV